MEQDDDEMNKLKATINSLNNEIINLNNKLGLFRITNSIQNLLLSSTLKVDFNINELVKAEHDAFVKSLQIRPQLQLQLQPNNQQPCDQPDKKKTCFKTIKTTVAVKEITEEEKQQRMATYETYINNSVAEQFGEMPVDELEDIIEKEFVSVGTAAKMNAALSAIRKWREGKLLFVSPQQYVEIVKNHVKRVLDVLTSKSIPEKKIETAMQKFLSTIEQRLINYPQTYKKFNLFPEDFQKYKLHLYMNIKHPRSFKPFESDNLQLFLSSYALAILPLRELLTMYFNNPFMYPNIVYFPLKETNDPYSFYVLDRVDTERRGWVMDCRLDSLCTEIQNVVQHTCLQLFKKLYYDVFNHNNYMSEYKTKSCLLEVDCDQLIKNYLLVQNLPCFNKILRQIIMEHATLTPSKEDKINLQSDDNLVYKKYSGMRVEETEFIDSVKLLFDTISEDEAKNLLQAHPDIIYLRV